MLGALIQPELEEFIQERNWRKLREVLMDLSLPDVADILTDVPGRDQVIVFRLLPREMATEVFEYLEPEDQQRLLAAFSDAEAAHILNEMSPDDRTDLLEEIPDRVARRVLRLLTPTERSISQMLLAYAEESVGRLMTPDFVKLKDHLTCAECVEHIRSVASEKETIYYIYIVDRMNHLRGVVSLRELIFSPAGQVIGELLDEEPREELICIEAEADQAEAVQLLRRYDLMALPVVDRQKHILGIVTFDDVMDVQTEEVTEDMQIMSGIMPTESSYRETHFTEMFPKRLAWLVALALTATLCGAVISRYQSVLKEIVALAFFIPVLMSTGGNTGSQACTLVIRSLTLKDVGVRDAGWIALRELGMGLALGVSLACVVGCIAGWFYGLQLGLAVGTALALAVLVSNLTGTMMPIALQALGLDPAYMATPCIATVSDLTGVFIYFEIAQHMMAIG
jgi:magnesium transporter